MVSRLLKRYMSIVSVIFLAPHLRLVNAFVRNSQVGNPHHQHSSIVTSKIELFRASKRPSSALKANYKKITTLRVWDPFQLSLTNIIGDNVDDILEHLVSPAPESFHVIDRAVKKMNCFDASCADSLSVAFMDIDTLAKLLVTKNFGILIYQQDEKWNWDIKDVDGDSKVIFDRANDELRFNFNQSNSQLYHKLSLLQLASLSMDIAKSEKSGKETSIGEIIDSMEKRCELTLGADLRGRASGDAAFQLALSGVQESSHLFNAFADIGIHELNRAGHRSSFTVKSILHLVERFAVCGMNSSSVLQMYFIAGVCLEKKGYDDTDLINSLKSGDFGLHSDRPCLWLWRFSAKQKKIKLSDDAYLHNKFRSQILWNDYFRDTKKPIVVDIGCGCGVSLLNLASICNDEDLSGNTRDIQSLEWPACNFAGVDLNKQLIGYANAVVSRTSNKRVHFFCDQALEFLNSLQTYPGSIAIIMIQFPSPFRLPLGERCSGNSQLPSTSTDGFMISDEMVEIIKLLLKKSGGLLLLQSKCEDVAVYTKRFFTESGEMECLPCTSAVKDIEQVYSSNKRPKRTDQWLQLFPDSERAQGKHWSSRSLLPDLGRTETEVQCENEKIVVHRCILKYKRKNAIQDFSDEQRRKCNAKTKKM